MLQSLDLYAELVGEPTPVIYDRFFEIHPEAEDEFAGDEDLQERMMLGVLQMLAGLADGTFTPDNFVFWAPDHKVYGVDVDMVFTMFGVIAAVIRDGLGERWTQDMDESWKQLVESLRQPLTRALAGSARSL